MKKISKKVISVVLAVVMTLGLTCTAFAGTITIDNSINGNDYYAYKILDATSDGNGNVAYTIKSDSVWYLLLTSDTGKKFFSVAETADANGNYAVTQVDDSSDTELTKWLRGCITVASDGTATVDGSSIAYDGTVTGSGSSVNIENLDPGYYFVSTNTGAVVSIDTAAADVNVIDKNPTISVEKVITHDDGREDASAEADGMGEDVSFDVFANVPMIEEDNFVVDYKLEDSLSNGLLIELSNDDFYEGSGDLTGHYYLSDDKINDWVTLYDGTRAIVDGGFTKNVYNYSFELLGYDVYTDATSGEDVHTFSGFVLTYYTFDYEGFVDAGGDEQTYEEIKDWFDKSNYPVNASIEIAYSAHVTSLEGYENTNVITLDYDITPWATPRPQNPDQGDTLTSIDYVYSWELDLLKISGDDPATPLEGATFTLESADMKDVAVGHSYLYVTLNSFDASGNYVYEGNTYNINDFESTYYIKDGDDYVVLDVKDVLGDVDPSSTYVRILTDKKTEAADGTTHSVEGISDASGHILFEGLGTGDFTLTEIVAPDGYNLLTEPIEFTISWDDDNGFTVTSTSGEYSFTDGYILSVDVENNAGSILPGTGGIGTNLFYIIGAILVCGAVVLLVSRRRMHSAE